MDNGLNNCMEPQSGVGMAPSRRVVVDGPTPHVAVRIFKRLFDITFSGLLLVLLSPILLIIVLLSSFSDGGPLFWQLRVGREGRLFHCYKFRTMIPNAEAHLAQLLAKDPNIREEWEANQKLRSDPRVTKIGSFLRRTSIDELPQLINVLRGDMSLVGPRPAMPNQLQLYGRGQKWYCAVRPGITGLWQVTARGEQDFRRRIALDCYYARHVSPLIDLAILVKTIKVVISGRGAF